MIEKIDKNRGTNLLSSLNKTHFEITIVKHNVIHYHKNISKNPTIHTFSAKTTNLAENMHIGQKVQNARRDKIYRYIPQKTPWRRNIKS